MYRISLNKHKKDSTAVSCVCYCKISSRKKDPECPLQKKGPACDHGCVPNAQTMAVLKHLPNVGKKPALRLPYSLYGELSSQAGIFYPQCSAGGFHQIKADNSLCCPFADRLHLYDRMKHF